MGKSERDRRRPVFLGRPHPGVERRPVEFPVPGVAHGAAGLARHLLGLDRQHQQPAHDERDLRSVATAGAGQILGARNSRTRQSRQQAVQRFRPERAADPAVSAAEYGMDPACAEGRLRFCGGARRLEPGLSEHRPLQRGMAAPFQSDPGRQDGDADRDHDGAGQFFLLAGDRGANPGHGAVFVEGVLSAQAGERAGRQCLSERPAGHNRAGQARLCRQLRDVPFEQGARPAGRRRSRRLHRPRLPRLLEPLLGVGPHRRFPQQDAPDGPGQGLPRRQLPLERCAGAGDPAADQRLQPARDQRDRRQHLGQFLLGLVQVVALGRHHHGLRPVHRQAARRTRCRPAGAAIRGSRH